MFRRIRGMLLLASAVLPAAAAPARAGSTERVSVSSTGEQANADSFNPALSADGRFVAFSSFADNLARGDTNGYHDVFVRDRETGTTELVSVGLNGKPANDGSGRLGLAISGNGRFVAFQSYATDLVRGDTNGVYDVYVRDRREGTTELVSVSSKGVQGDLPSRTTSISADGRVVAFTSYANNLVEGDTNKVADVFVHTR